MLISVVHAAQINATLRSKLTAAIAPGLQVKLKAGLYLLSTPYAPYLNMWNLARLAFIGFFFAQALFQHNYLQSLKSNFSGDKVLFCSTAWRPGTAVASGFLRLLESPVCTVSQTSIVYGMVLPPSDKATALVSLVQKFNSLLVLLWYCTASSPTWQVSFKQGNTYAPLRKTAIRAQAKKCANSRVAICRVNVKKPLTGSSTYRSAEANQVFINALLYNNPASHLNQYADVGNFVVSRGSALRLGIFQTPFFLTDSYATLRTHYTCDSGRGSHVIRDSGFFFNLGDANLASTFLSYYSSFFYGLLSPVSNTAAIAITPQSPISKLSNHSAPQVVPVLPRVNGVLPVKRTVGGRLGLRNVGDASGAVSDADDALSLVINPATGRSAALGNLGNLPYQSRSRELARVIFPKHESSRGASRTFGLLPTQASADAYEAPVFQMKPGYLGLWRHYRRLFAKYSPLRYFRQRRWTNYFLSLKSLSGSPVLLSLEFSCLAVLRASQFFLLTADSAAAIQSGCIFVNGILSAQPTAQLYTGDCVQLLLSWDALIYFARSYQNYSMLKHQFIPKALAAASGISAYTGNSGLSSFLGKLSIGGFDVPNYLEVDYLSCSVFVLYSPIFSFELNPVISAVCPVFAMRLYNWKYVI